jgi:hypothetical protein
MMEFIEGHCSERKLTLFGCACCYRQWPIIPDGCCRTAVETAERFADGHCDGTELRRARERVKEEYPHLFWYQEFGCHAEAASYYAAFDAAAAREMEADHPLDGPGDYLAVLKWCEVAGLIASAVSSPQSPTLEADWKREAAAQCAILRDIFDNPFRPVQFDASWRTRTAVAVAQVIYDERNFGLLPVLADALEDAGCEDADVLSHCRHPGEHVRGCWVVDLVLGKE